MRSAHRHQVVLPFAPHHTAPKRGIDVRRTKQKAHSQKRRQAVIDKKFVTSLFKRSQADNSRDWLLYRDLHQLASTLLANGKKLVLVRELAKRLAVGKLTDFDLTNALWPPKRRNPVRTAA